MKLKPIKATEGDTVKMSEVFDRIRYDALVDLFIDGRPSFDEAEAAAHAIMNYDWLLAACERALNYAKNVARTEGVYFDDDDDLTFIESAVKSAKGGKA